METGLLTRLRDTARASPQELGLLILLSVAVVSAGVFVVVKTSDTPAPPVRRVAAPSPSQVTLLVHVAGVVRSPGVYSLVEGSRVKDAIAAAGGPADGADLNQLNLASLLTDGEKVMVPQAGAQAASEGGEPSAEAKVNLNTATQSQLEQLPGVGPVLAKRIIDHRSKKRFTSTRQLLEVEGFGQKKYEGLKDLITV